MSTTTFPRIPGHRRCCEILGNGDFRAGKELIQQLAHRLEHARAKHPWPAHAPGNHGALAALLGEMGEVVDEIHQRRRGPAQGRAFGRAGRGLALDMR